MKRGQTFKKLKGQCREISFNITIDVTGGEKSKRPWAIEQYLTPTALKVAEHSF